MKQLLLKIVYFLLIGTASTSCLANHLPDPVAQKGILDLRRLDLLEKPVALDGEWVFCWNQLLTPDSPKALTPPIYTPFPSLWSELRRDGRPLPSQGYATYLLTVLLPKNRSRIGLEVPDVYCSYRLYVNGVLQIQNGQPGRTKEEAIPFWTTRTIPLATGLPDTLHLLLQVANFWHAKGGTYRKILIGDKDMLFLKKNRDAAYDLLLAGCLFMGGLFFLGLFVFGRHDKSALYFSLFCIFHSYRAVGSDLYVLHSLLPDMNWFITVRIEYVTLALCSALFTVYTKLLFPKDAHPAVMKWISWLCLSYSALIILTPPLLFTRFLNPFLAIMFVYTIYLLYVYLQAARNRRSGSLYALMSSGVMAVILLLINMNYFGLIPPMRGMIFTGYITFFFLQSLSLSHRFAYNLKQATLLAQQGLKTKSEFLSTMSHEIRTPLNAVIGMTHLMLRKDPRQDQKEDLDVLLFSANNLLSIVNNILDYNKIEEGKIAIENIPMDLPAIARNILAGLKTAAREKGIGLHIRVDERLNRKFTGDPTRTSQVITNLVHNAIKFTKEGSVTLFIDLVSTTSEAATIMMGVEDTGIGIEPEKHKMIFDRFTQADSSTNRSYGGTGLGLAITKKILELQGVQLQLSSTPGKGSRFYFTQTFPLGSEITEAEQAPPDFYGKTKALQGISLLLVEDNPINVLVAQTILESSGAIVEVATNGLEALEALDSSKHQLILMDLHMPVMDGYEATVLLRKRGETLPIIALTASIPKEVESGAYAAGLTDIVVKPFNPDDLNRVILQYIRASGQ